MSAGLYRAAADFPRAAPAPPSFQTFSAPSAVEPTNGLLHWAGLLAVPILSVFAAIATAFIVKRFLQRSTSESIRAGLLLGVGPFVLFWTVQQGFFLRSGREFSFTHAWLLRNFWAVGPILLAPVHIVCFALLHYQLVGGHTYVKQMPLTIALAILFCVYLYNLSALEVIKYVGYSVSPKFMRITLNVAAPFLSLLALCMTEMVNWPDYRELLVECRKFLWWVPQVLFVVIAQVEALPLMLATFGRLRCVIIGLLSAMWMHGTANYHTLGQQVEDAKQWRSFGIRVIYETIFVGLLLDQVVGTGTPMEGYLLTAFCMRMTVSIAARIVHVATMQPIERDRNVPPPPAGVAQQANPQGNQAVDEITDWVTDLVVDFVPLPGPAKRLVKRAGGRILNSTLQRLRKKIDILDLPAPQANPNNGQDVPAPQAPAANNAQYPLEHAHARAAPWPVFYEAQLQELTHALLYCATVLLFRAEVF